MNLKSFAKENRNRNLAKKFGSNFNRQIYELIRNSWGDYGRKEVDELIRKLDVIVVAYTRRLIFGFTGYSWIEYEHNGYSGRILRVSLTVVDSSKQRSGLMTRMLAKVIMRAVWDIKKTKFYIGCRTADPIVYGFILKYCRNTFPRMDGLEIPERFVKLARTISEIIDPKVYFDPKVLLAKGAYKNRLSLLEKKMVLLDQSSQVNPKICDFFKRNIDYKNGDAIIIISQFDKHLFYSAVKRYIRTLIRIK